ncbi:MAG: hypothetical protein ACHQFX_17800 [Chitinophagales bacterium]
MRERPFYFVVVSILFFNVEIFSQQKTPESIKLPINYTTLANYSFEDALKLDYPPKGNTTKLMQISCDSTIIKPEQSLIVLSPSFYSTHLSFFCRKEVQFEKITSVPLRFRLGSVDQVNYLERKPNALKPL